MFFRWKAPADFEGEVFFRYSAVVEYDKYWVNKDTPKIRVTRSAPAVAAPAPETPVTSSNTEAPEQGDSNSKILFPEEEEKQTSVAVDPVRMSWLIQWGNEYRTSEYVPIYANLVNLVLTRVTRWL